MKESGYWLGGFIEKIDGRVVDVMVVDTGSVSGEWKVRTGRGQVRNELRPYMKDFTLDLTRDRVSNSHRRVTEIRCFMTE